MPDQYGITRTVFLPDLPRDEHGILRYLDLERDAMFKAYDELAKRLNEFLVEREWTVTTLAQFTANKNDLDIGTGIAYRASSDASRNVTGVLAPLIGRMVIFFNTGAQNIVFQHQNAGSVAANRFITITAADVTVAGGGNFQAWYDLDDARWRQI